MFLPIPSQFVSHKGFHQCVNHKKKLTLRHPSPTFGSFSFFQASIWLGVDKVLQELTKSYKNELRHLFQCCIFNPRKCLRKTLFQHKRGEGGHSIILIDHLSLSQSVGTDFTHHISSPPPLDFQTFRRLCLELALCNDDVPQQ